MTRFDHVVSLRAVAASSALLAAGSFASAGISPGVYALANHPDGSQNPPSYGLRLDELGDVTAGHDVFTFDFDDPDSEMFLEYDGSSIHIHGTAFGGLDTGGVYDAVLSGLWDIDFTYTVVEGAPGDDDLVVTTANFSNTGTITPLAPIGDFTDAIALGDYAGSHDFTFRFGDEDDDQGHRGFDGLSGWGWLGHGDPLGHVSASDWLFTATAVPGAPGALILGLGMVAPRRRRR